MNVKLAKIEDIPTLEAIYEAARRFMKESGNEKQWQGGYPSRSVIEADINAGRLFTVVEDGEILAVFAFAKGNEPAYDKIYGGSWLDNGEYAYIHRVAVKCAGRGVASFIFSYCTSLASSVRIDTHRDNIPMQKALSKAGFSYQGIIYLENGDERLAYQKLA